MSDWRNRDEIENEDDIVLAPMNVEGMPWYRKKSADFFAGPKSDYQYSKKEAFYIVLGTLKAAFLVAGAYIGAFALLILLICLFS